jgi:hypothetical protein
LVGVELHPQVREQSRYNELQRKHVWRLEAARQNMILKGVGDSLCNFLNAGTLVSMELEAH